MRSIEFLRHAESAANVGLPTSDPGDIPLTGTGRLADDAAARDYEGPLPDLIVVSPYRRAQETATPFRKRFAITLIEKWPVQDFTYSNPAPGPSFVSGVAVLQYASTKGRRSSAELAPQRAATTPSRRRCAIACRRR